MMESKIYRVIVEINKKLDIIESSIINFLGFFDMSEEKKRELERDIESARKGKTLKEVAEELGVKL